MISMQPHTQLKKRIAVFPGSFDPITIGHVDIIRRAASMFDEVIVAMGVNTSKQYMYPLAKRMQMMQQSLGMLMNVRLMSYEGLTVDFCKAQGANYIVRGIRTNKDYEFEADIAEMNRKLVPELETVFLLSKPEHAAISSTIVREILKSGGDIRQFLPENAR
jgi:pantetheine-phosphate adenylyltransferase